MIPRTSFRLARGLARAEGAATRLSPLRIHVRPEPPRPARAPLQARRSFSSAGGRAHAPAALPSVAQACEHHRTALRKGESVKATFTDDPATLDLASSILEGHPHELFLRGQLLTPRADERGLLGSRRVVFAPIENEGPEIREAYRRQAGEVSLVCVGGPASLDTAFLADLMAAGDLQLPIGQVSYVAESFLASNLASSALQLHARHGTALNADPHLTGHALLRHFLSRAVFGVSEQEALEPDFRKIDLPLGALTPDKLRIYVGNELNWLRQSLRAGRGLLTEHDLNRRMSVVSRDILRAAQQWSGLQLAVLPQGPQDALAIHIDLTEAGREATLQENAELRERVRIESEPLSPQRIASIFGDQAPNIAGATVYRGDGAFRLEGHDMVVDHLEGQGRACTEDRVERVLFARDAVTGRAKVAGVVTSEGKYLYASHLKLSLGYMASFGVEPLRCRPGLRAVLDSAAHMLGASSPIPDHRLTTATGASVTAIFHLTPALRRLLDEHGTLPQYAVTNSHWTLLAAKGDKALVRITGGGNTGVEDYNPAYFLNLVANTERIFGREALVGIVSTYGCPRALNSHNSTQFAQAGNVVVSYGKGGTGNTKRHAEALMSLCLLFPEFKGDVLGFLDGYLAESGQPLGQAFDEIHALAAGMGFVDDEQARLDRALGYDTSISPAEKLVLAVLLLAVSAGIGIGRELAPPAADPQVRSTP